MLYDLTRPGVEVGRLHDHNRQVHKLDFNPLEGRFLLSGSQDGTVRLWDLRDFRQKDVLTFYSRSTYYGRGDGVRHTKWSTVQTWDFALGTDDGFVQRWDTRMNRAPVLKILAHSRTCTSIDWHPDGKHLVSGSRDKDVKVWNLQGERKQKPAYQIRAPNEVHNVRWRPPCLVSDSLDQNAKQCTHLATSYREYPLVHIWDLRKPFSPLREIYHQVNNGTTDMMWQSKDTLWTVGPGGEFTQSDVRYAPKSLDRRPMQALAMGPSGDVTFFTQRRPSHALFDLEDSSTAPSTPTTNRPKTRSPEPKSAGTSFGGGDSFEENSMSKLVAKGRLQDSSLVSSSSIGSTPPTYEDVSRPVRELDQTMQNREQREPRQVAKYGPLDMSLGPIFKVLAQRRKCNDFSDTKPDDLLEYIKEIFGYNAKLSWAARRTAEAQAWSLLFHRFSDAASADRRVHDADKHLGSYSLNGFEAVHSASNSLRELFEWFTSGQMNVQLAIQLFVASQPILSSFASHGDTDPKIRAMAHPIDPERLSSAFATYHSQLRATSLFEEAAQVLAYSHKVLQDTEITHHNAQADRMESFAGAFPTGRDSSKPSCPYCWDARKSGLWSSCANCNHGMHMDCAVEWLGSPASGGGSCAVESCGCMCMNGVDVDGVAAA